MSEIAVCRQLRKAEKDVRWSKEWPSASAVGALTTYAQDMKENAKKAQKFIENVMDQIMAKLNEIDFHILRLGQLSSSVAINSSETVVILKDLKGQLEKTAALGPEPGDPSIQSG